MKRMPSLVSGGHEFQSVFLKFYLDLRMDCTTELYAEVNEDRATLTVSFNGPGRRKRAVIGAVCGVKGAYVFSVEKKNQIPPCSPGLLHLSSQLHTSIGYDDWTDR